MIFSLRVQLHPWYRESLPWWQCAGAWRLQFDADFKTHHNYQIYQINTLTNRLVTNNMKLLFSAALLLIVAPLCIQGVSIFWHLSILWTKTGNNCISQETVATTRNVKAYILLKKKDVLHYTRKENMYTCNKPCLVKPALIWTLKYKCRSTQTIFVFYDVCCLHFIYKCDHTFWFPYL